MDRVAPAVGRSVRSTMAFWLFSSVPADMSSAEARRRIDDALQAQAWEVADAEPHRGSLSAGDLVLVYLGAPDRVLLARTELVSAVQPLAPDAALRSDPAGRSGVLLGDVAWWDPPVPMDAVLARIDPVNNARADFANGVVGITRDEFEAALAAAADH